MGDSERSRREFLAQTCAVAAVAAAGAERAALLAASPAAATGVVYDERYKKHVVPPGHPDKPERLDAIVKALGERPLAGRLTRIDPRAATDEELLLVHTKEYLRTVRADVAADRRYLSTGDTPLCKDSLTAALLAAGGILAAVDAVAAGKVANAFCAVRPPGHHAGPKRGMGFCIFNNVALAARYAQKAHKLQRVVIADWDVHHGNGTQDTFYEDGDVLFFSTHQWPLYPGTGRAEETGKGKGKGMTINCPFTRGAGRAEIMGAFETRLLPAIEKLKPELVLISAGFDSRKGDPLGEFTLTDTDFADLTKLMLQAARKHAGGRLVSTLEGGYNLAGLASATAAHVKALSQG